MLKNDVWAGWKHASFTLAPLIALLRPILFANVLPTWCAWVSKGAYLIPPALYASAIHFAFSFRFFFFLLLLSFSFLIRIHNMLSSSSSLSSQPQLVVQMPRVHYEPRKQNHYFDFFSIHSLLHSNFTHSASCVRDHQIKKKKITQHQISFPSSVTNLYANLEL